jgi:putative hemolysin
MQVTTVVKLALFILCLLFSAFFSGSETAVFSLTNLEREKLRRKSGGPIKRFLSLLPSKSDDLLVTILTGNMIVNMFATALFENMLPEVVSFASETAAFLVPIISMTLILLIAGEMLPKSIAVRNPSSTVRVVGVPLSFVYRLLSPLRAALVAVKRLLTITPRTRPDDREMIRAAIRIGLREGIIDQLDYNLFDSFFNFNRMTAEDVMLPRIEISGVDVDTPIPEILSHCEQMSRDAAHSLLLVYRETIDHPVGYVEIKDLVPFRFNVARKSLAEIIRPCHAVPATKKLNELLRELKALNISMALAVDEYGGTAGLVTFHRLIEYILSSFYASQGEAIRALGRNTYAVPGSLDLKTLQETLPLPVESEARTAAGLFIERLGEIPEEGARLRIGNVVLTVTKMQKNRILSLKAEVLP